MLIDDEILEGNIFGYLPHKIYAFETNSYPNYLKIGDTYRDVDTRLNEWRQIYQDLEKKFEDSAMILEDGETIIFYRDHAVHTYLTVDRKKDRLSKNKNEREFFKDTNAIDLIDAIVDIREEFHNDGSNKYTYYKVSEQNSIVERHYARNKNYAPRENQKNVIEAIKSAIENRQTNLLLYAVMRFGKSNVEMWAAKELNAKLTVIISGKADMMEE